LAILTREGFDNTVTPLQIFQGVTASPLWAKPLEEVAVRTQCALGMREARLCKAHSLSMLPQDIRSNLLVAVRVLYLTFRTGALIWVNIHR
jgi:hypothetical protein